MTLRHHPSPGNDSRRHSPGDTNELPTPWPQTCPRGILKGMTPLAHHLYGSPAEPVLVLLHAYPLNSRMWDGVIALLHEHDADLPILTVDAPGFGDSPSGEDVARMVGGGEEPSLDTFAEALEAMLRELDIEQIVLAGLSLGGYAALAYAEKYPDRICGIGMLDTKAEADEEPARKVRLATAAKVLTEGTEAIASSINAVLGETTLASRPDVVAELKKEIAAAPPAGVAWIQRAMATRPGRMHVLEALNVPALVLRGEEDTLSPAPAAEAMVAALGAAPLVTIPGVGHMSATEAPEPVAKALADLYARSAAAT